MKVTSELPIRAACVLLEREGLILAVETAHRPGELSLPGGGVDPGEAPGDAAIREALEETGLVVQIDPAPVHVGRSGAGLSLVATFRVRSFQGTPTPGSDALAVRWVTRAELLDPRNRYAEHNRRVVEATKAPGLTDPQ